MDRKKIILIAVICAVCVAVAAAVLIIGKLRTGTVDPITPLTGKTVGTDFGSEDFNEFYYTYCFTGYPPEYRRYRLYTEDGKHMFYHEWRDESTFSFSPDCPPSAGTTVELTEKQWKEFWSCLEGGTVVPRTENIEDGGDGGPSFFLYWNGDKGNIREFSFASQAQLKKFEKLSRALGAEETPSEE